MSQKIYNKVTGASKTVTDSQVASYLRTGQWSTTPQSGLATAAREGGGYASGSTSSAPQPDLGGGEEEDTGMPSGIGTNLSATQVQGLYDDGILSYEAATEALQRSGIFPEEAELLLAGRGPEAEVEGWMDTVATNLLDILTAGATDAGFADPKSYASSFLDYYWADLSSAVWDHQGLVGTDRSDPNNIRSFIETGRRWLQGKWGHGTLPKGGTSGSGRGGGGGGGRSVAQSFDVDQLAQKINETWQAYTLSDAPNAHALAKQYVSQVAGNPSQALDFSTWVRKRLEGTDEWKFVMRNKPAGIDPADYIKFYASNVFGVLGPTGDAPTVARNAAALGASPDALEGRLKFHGTVTKSSNYINRIEQRYRSVRNVLGAF